MEQIVAAIIGAIAVIGGSIWNDNRGYKKLDFKIGKLDNTTLSGQHDNIEKTIITKTENLEKLQDKEFNRIYTKVDKTNEIIVRNEGLYQNLNLDQREIKNNLDKLVYEWQSLIVENRELKREIENLKEQNNILNNKLLQKEDQENEWDREL